MQRIKQNSLSLLTILACGIVTVGIAMTGLAQENKGTDPTGNWYWLNPGRNGNPGSTNTLMLKATGSAVTGTLKTPARGGKMTTSEISEGKLSGSELTFVTTRTIGTNEINFNYAGIVSEDSIKGTIKMERNGQKRSRKWEAKRATGPVQSGAAQ